MGFLDHSTNNIIIDAVLTDFGRKLLAENQGAFKIAFFSLGDDEVDYTTVRKFGRTVGKEKISKNTPIFEAHTTAQQALKHRLITLPDPLITEMPSLTFSVSSGAEATAVGSTVTIGSGGMDVTLSFSQQTSTGGTVPDGLVDQTYTVLVNDRFLSLTGTGTTKINTSANSRIAAYSVSRTGTDSSTGGSIADFKITRKSLSQTVYTQFGDFADKTKISSVVSVIGDQSGLRKDIKIVLTQYTGG